MRAGLASGKDAIEAYEAQMSAGGRIYLIEPEERSYINGPILDMLARSRHEVRYYPSFTQLAAVGDSLEAVDVLISLTCSREQMAQARALRAIINPYSGCEHIDRAAANERLLIVGHGAIHENAVGVAEATILLLLSCFYNLAQSERVLRDRLPRPRITARMLCGKTIGIIGYGRIAQAVAHRLQPWGARLLVAAPRLHAALPEGVTHTSLESLLTQSDAVLVLCSLGPETRNILSRERLMQIKRGAVLVNTARGGLIDESALADLMMAGHFGRVALDASAVEPLPADSPLRQVPEAILTPHMIGHTVEAEAAMAAAAAESALRVLEGKPPVHVFNREILELWLKQRGHLV